MPAAAGPGPPFDLPVPADGYAWWYLDATSDDGRHGLTLIAFVGSVFSPFYAAARRRQGAVDPVQHCALNVAFYGDVRRWAMTERDAGALQRTAHEFRLGPSQLRWRGGELDIEVAEVTVPWPSRLRGRIRVQPLATTDFQATLDQRGGHRWQPVAPRARVELEFSAPALRWSGHGYLDSNRGDEPLEDAFTAWHWSRMQTGDGATQCLLRRGPPRRLVTGARRELRSLGQRRRLRATARRGTAADAVAHRPPRTTGGRRRRRLARGGRHPVLCAVDDAAGTARSAAGRAREPVAGPFHVTMGAGAAAVPHGAQEIAAC